MTCRVVTGNNTFVDNARRTTDIQRSQKLTMSFAHVSLKV